jgi:prefoldin subunit 5|tara:strand:+ start:254 stop:445 length:192 start_codon:yes stop_codon:yes gene_type:complete
VEKGPNDLEAVIERLEFRNAKLHHHNEKIELEIIELRKDNKRLTKEINDRQEHVDFLRRTGAI